MRSARILYLFAAAARALRPVPVVQRRALLGGGAAAFVRERCSKRRVESVAHRDAVDAVH